MYLEEMSEYSVMKKAYCTVFHVGICRKVGEQIPEDQEFKLVFSLL